MNKKPLISTLLAEIADELRIELLIEPEYRYAGRIKTKDGRVFFFHSTKFDINGLGASEIAKDKGYAAYFMSQLGYPVPEGEAFYSKEWCRVVKSDKDAARALKYARKIGFPLIVKPNSQSQGKGVEKVYSEKALKVALAYIFDGIKDKVALVQKIVNGSDYRIVVLDEEVLCVYLRRPLSVLGDGTHTINELLSLKQQEFVARGRDTVISLTDPRIARRLDRNNLRLTSVLKNGEYARLLDNANLSSGGESSDVTEAVHQSWKDMAIKLTQDMGLRYCGVDVMTASPINEKINNYTIIEINSAPGLDYYAQGGNKQKQIVRKLYRKLLTGFIS